MNREFLGDALDHWKGSVFEYLQNAKVLREFAVDPMATDAGDWTPEDYAVFARLLRIRPDQIVEHQCPVAASDDYFAEIHHSGDLFLDPDTGLLTSRAKDPRQYVTPRHLQGLLQQAKDRVVAVYQHVRAQKTSVRVDRCVAAVAAAAPGVAWCSYESGTVAMLFFGRSSGRVTTVYDSLRALLGKNADHRVRRGGPTSGCS